MSGWTFGFALGLLFGALLAVGFVVNRIHALSAVDFEIHSPAVPLSVVETVRQAETDFYANQSAPRRAIEMAQDVTAFLYPPIVYRLDFSVGPFRLKGHTLAKTIPWALTQGFWEIENAPARDFHWFYVYFAEQPGLAKWGAAVHLEYLRQQHPLMRDIAWTDIAADPHLVAKIYSGYLGAGGDWAMWEADLRPGSVARARLGLTTPPQL